MKVSRRVALHMEVSMILREWTPSIIVAIPLFLGLLDVLLYWLGGNDATISVAMLRARARNPLVILSTTWTFGLFIGHVYFPTFTHTPPPSYEVLARLCVCLSPTIYALIVLRFGGAAADEHLKALEGTSPWRLFIIANLFFLLGQLAGMYALCQHLKPSGE